jgi:two-component system nitrate/nitrite response regulator NarL
MAVENKEQETKCLFLCNHGRMLPRWTEAFRTGRAGKPQTASAKAEAAQVNLVWLRLGQGVSLSVQFERLGSQFGQAPCVVLSDQPTDEEALAAFADAARGYCNTHANAQLLVQIASVVLQGGLWIGEPLMQRLIGATSRIQAASRGEGDEEWSKNLTEREKEVASTLAKGASNKEIASALNITERTVKAHITAILEKLQVRDRLQLSLIVNRLTSSQA